MLSIKDTEKRRVILTKNTIYCSCGHSVPIPKWLDRKMCSWCNHWVYRTPELEEKYKEEQKKKDFIKNMKELIK